MTKRIMFFDYFTAWRIHSQFNAVVAKALQVRNGEVAAVRCRGLFRRAFENGLGSDCGINATCEMCQGQGDNLYNSLGIPQIYIDDYITRADLDLYVEWAQEYVNSPIEDIEYHGEPFGLWAMSQVLTICRVQAKEINHPEARSQAWPSLFIVYLSYVASTRILQSWRPDKVLLFNGRFVPYRVAFEVARAQGVPAIAHERGYYGGKGYLLYENDHPPHMGIYRRIFNCWRNIPLKQEEIEVCEDLIMERKYGIKYGNIVNYYENFTKDAPRKNVRDLLGIPNDVKVLGIFTSSSDESWTTEESCAAIDQLPFLDNLIEVMRGREEWLLIRHHPNIAGRAGSLPESTVLKQLYKLGEKLPPNVRMIMPHEEITSYDLIYEIDAAFNLYSTFSFEVAAHGVPCICFDGSGISYLPTVSIPDYKKETLSSAIDKVLSLDRSALERDIVSCYRFYYHAIFRPVNIFKSFWIGNDWEAVLNIQGIENFLPGDDYLLDHICDSLLYDAPLYQYPSLESRAYSLEPEKSFAASRYDEYRARRATPPQPLVQQNPRIAVIVPNGSDMPTGNILPSVEYVESVAHGSLLSVLQMLPERVDEYDFVVINIGGATYDLTALQCGALALSEEATSQVLAIFAGWKVEDDSLMLRRLDVTTEHLLQEYNRNGPTKFLIDTLPRIIWRPRSFKAFLGQFDCSTEQFLAESLIRLLSMKELTVGIDKARVFVQ